MITSYNITVHDMYLADHADEAQNTHAELQAIVASGDYFDFLATQLDEISQKLKNTRTGEYVTLERLIADLAYLQTNYTVKRREILA